MFIKKFPTFLSKLGENLIFLKYDVTIMMTMVLMTMTTFDITNKRKKRTGGTGGEERGCKERADGGGWRLFIICIYLVEHSPKLLNSGSSPTQCTLCIIPGTHVVTHYW